MSYDEFCRWVRFAGLTLGDFARLMHMHRNSMTNLGKAGRVPDHLAVIAILLAELKDRNVDFEPVLARINFTPKKPRGGKIKRADPV